MSFRGILSAVILVFSEGLILQGPSSPLVAQLGGVLRLPCSVETPLPLDELEVEWRRTDSKALVHLFQEGESRPESQSDAYRDRAHFFTEREIANGNYSLLLRNVTTDDAGMYSCGVYTNEETGEIAVEIEAIERLVLKGADRAVTANVGEEVILNCSVDSHIPPEEVSWAKVDSDESHMLVLLFQENETYPGDSSYQGRTEFFTSEIPKGNFSLRLKDVRTEDKGEYICKAHSGLLSANTTVILQELGLSSMHILVLVLCGSAFVVALVVSAMILLDIKERQTMRKCEVLRKYSAMEDGELDMVEGEIIEILQKDGWSLGKHNGKVGLFPSNCIQEMSTFQETGKVMKSKVRRKYSAKKDDELDLVAGETIEILEVIDDEWYRGNYNGKVGLFPSHLVQEISPLQGKVMQGKVLHGYSAMKDEELDLVAGETIEILQMDNRKWSLGKHKGKVGLFPLSHVREISALQDITQRALRMHYVLVFGPSVLMFTAFVLWGVIEGFLSEVVICSTLNLIRFITLFKTSLYQKKLPEKIKTIIKEPFDFEYIIVVNVLYFVIFYNVWSVERESKALAFMGIMYGSSLHMSISSFFTEGGFMEMMDVSYLFTLSFLSRTFNETAFISMFAGMFVVPVSNWILNAIVEKKYPFLKESELYWLFHLGWMTLTRLIISVVVFYFFDQILESNEERAGLLSVTALLQLLALSGIFDYVNKPSLAETPKTILYMYGAFGVVAANAITLATELMLKLRKGQRTLTDLRVIVLPFECVFVLSWIALWTHAYWRKMQNRIKQEVAILRRFGRRRWLKFLRDGAKLSEAREMLSQSAPPPAEPDTPQASSPEPPPEAETEIDSIEKVPEDTDTNSPGQVGKNDSHFPDTTPERAEEDCKVEANADTDGHTTGSPLSVDVHINAHSCETISENDSLLNHGQSVVPTDFTKPRDSSAQESSPLLGKDISESVPPSES